MFYTPAGCWPLIDKVLKILHESINIYLIKNMVLLCTTSFMAIHWHFCAQFYSLGLITFKYFLKENTGWLCDEAENLSVYSLLAIFYLLGPFGSSGEKLTFLLLGIFLWCP